MYETHEDFRRNRRLFIKEKEGEYRKRSTSREKEQKKKKKEETPKNAAEKEEERKAMDSEERRAMIARWNQDEEVEPVQKEVVETQPEANIEPPITEEQAKILRQLMEATASGNLIQE